MRLLLYHDTAVFIRVARAAHGLQVPTLRGAQDGRKWSGRNFLDMSAHEGEEAQKAECWLNSRVPTQIAQNLAGVLV